MGRLIDTDDLIMYLDFENREEEREENGGDSDGIEGIVDI